MRSVASRHLGRIQGSGSDKLIWPHRDLGSQRTTQYPVEDWGVKEQVEQERSSRRGVLGPAPLTRQREEYAGLIARGLSDAHACRIVGVNRRTGTRWRYGRTVPARVGGQRQYPGMIDTKKQVPARSPRYLSQDERGADRRRTAGQGQHAGDRAGTGP